MIVSNLSTYLFYVVLSNIPSPLETACFCFRYLTHAWGRKIQEVGQLPNDT
jgi:hypothetical protein